MEANQVPTALRVMRARSLARSAIQSHAVSHMPGGANSQTCAVVLHAHRLMRRLMRMRRCRQRNAWAWKRVRPSNAIHNSTFCSVQCVILASTTPGCWDPSDPDPPLIRTLPLSQAPSTPPLNQTPPLHRTPPPIEQTKPGPGSAVCQVESRVKDARGTARYGWDQCAPVACGRAYTLKRCSPRTRMHCHAAWPHSHRGRAQRGP